MSKFDVFEYAGKSSSIYNLVSCEINKDYNNIISGAEYEPSVDTLPHSVNQLLLGLDYSDKPLEFDLEIVNPDENIPDTQVEEIKDWLFGQNGWKKFVLINERQRYYLRALLIPSEDIFDVNGQRGFRCKLRNDSGFWYKDEDIEIPLTYSSTNIYSIIEKTIDLDYIPDRMEINPKIKFSTYAPSIKKTVDIVASEDNKLTITDSDGTPHSVSVIHDGGNYQDEITGSYDRNTHVFTVTNPSSTNQIMSGYTYTATYWIKQDNDSGYYWKENCNFNLLIINTLNDSVMAFDGVDEQFDVVVDCLYGTYTMIQNGAETEHNLKYPPFIDNDTKYSNLFYLSRGQNQFKIYMRLWLDGNGVFYTHNQANNGIVDDKIIISFTSLHRIGGF